MNMGIGVLGQPATIIKRKFRYTLGWETPTGNIPPNFVKMAKRPELNIDEVEINFLNAVSWVPGKGRWQPMTVTYIDVVHQDIANLYRWVSRVYDFNTYAASGSNLPQSEKAGWSATGILSMYDGCGKELERWTLFDCFPTNISGGDLDMGSSDEANIDLTVRFARAQLTMMCGPTFTPAGCVGCGGGSNGGTIG